MTAVLISISSWPHPLVPRADPLQNSNPIRNSSSHHGEALSVISDAYQTYLHNQDYRRFDNNATKSEASELRACCTGVLNALF